MQQMKDGKVKKGEVVPVLNELSTTPWRRVGELRPLRRPSSSRCYTDYATPAPVNERWL
jgi:hypothetical protein